MNRITQIQRAACAFAFTLGFAFSTSEAHAQTDSVLFVSKSGTTLLRVNSNGNVGIGAVMPAVRFQVSTGGVAFQGNDGFVATGTYGAGSIPVTGAGARMMWYPRKGAFRVGMVSGNHWDDGNVGDFSFAGGFNATASGPGSFVFGNGATASGFQATAIGPGSTASADNAVAIGGGSASGASSFALGTFASTNGHTGSFVFADVNSTTLAATNVNQFRARASGGFTFFTSADATSGAELASGSGSWSTLSDRNRKEHFVGVDGEDILSRLRSVPMTTWNYTTQDRAIRHMGPMAQDFYVAFGLGESNLMISTVDIDGINMAAVQAVSARTDFLRDENAKQTVRITLLERENAALRERLDRIEALLVLRTSVSLHSNGRPRESKNTLP
jgi:trimeric autotransporter adhesin